MKFIWMVITGIMITSSFVLAAGPQNYTISYTFKNPDGTVFQIIKYYLYDNNKIRTEYFSTVQYKINADAEASTDLSDSGNTNANSGAQMQAEQLTIFEPHTIEILRKDKNIVWTISPEFKQYSEVPLRPDSWEHDVTGRLVWHYR